MIVRILGSAAGGGVPQWNCGCGNCVRARNGEAPMRTQSSIAVSADERAWLLINVSVDLARQFAATPELWPVAARATPFAAVLLTDANVDHTAGLAELRQDPDAFVVLSTPVVKSLLVPQLAYERFDRPPHRWIACDPGGRDIAPDIDDAIAAQFEIRMVDVPGLLPGYAGRGTARGAVVAYVLRERASGASVLAAPVFSDLDETLMEAARASDVVLLDGSFFSDDEMPRDGLMRKTARSLGHAPVGGVDGTLARVRGLANRRVFVHLNNSNPVLDPASPAAQDVAAAGCEIAYDGMRISVARV